MNNKIDKQIVSNWMSTILVVLDMPEWGEMTEQIDWRAKQPSQVVWVSEDLKC